MEQPEHIEQIEQKWQMTQIEIIRQVEHID